LERFFPGKDGGLVESRRGENPHLVEALLRGLALLGDVAECRAEHDCEVGQIHVASGG